MKLSGQIVDVFNRSIFSGEITINKGKITAITSKRHEESRYIMPGFIDAHIHIESAMLVPSEFARVAVKHGTVATVSDPHEIANVLGVEGIKFMIANGKKTPFKFNFGAPPCVPATNFETAGATINADDVKALLALPEIKYLAEMMNYPGVIYDDSEVLKKIAWAHHFNKPIDGHAPGLRGDTLTKYIKAGISTDHECFTQEEALEKLKKGMKILIREGSAAKNFEALINLLPQYFNALMFCSDDKHPDDLLLGHINQLCARAVAKGFDFFKILQVACINPVTHYKLDVGMLRVGDPADFIVVEDLKTFKTYQTYIDGRLVFDKGTSKIDRIPIDIRNVFKTQQKHPSDFKIKAQSQQIRVIEALEGELITKAQVEEATVAQGNLVSNLSKDILKMAIVNRYDNQLPAIAFIKNFGLKQGAIASSVAHDSHNIIVVGVDDASICAAVNLIIESQGGISVVSNKTTQVMPLPVAGIMSDQDADSVAKQYTMLDQSAKALGCKLNAPFMTLSFMALLVIPSLKLSDKGLFNGDTFKFETVAVH